jgi:ketosteroid isomerase-like protein
MAGVEADTELVLPSAPPHIYVAWAALWLAANERSQGGDSLAADDGSPGQVWTDRFMARVAVPSVREQAVEAQRAGAPSVSPRVRAEPEVFAQALSGLGQTDLSSPQSDRAAFGELAPTEAQVQELHEQIRTSWASLAASLQLGERSMKESVFHSGYDAFQQGDLVAMQRWFAPEAILTVPGSTPYSGTYRGLPEILALLTLSSDRLGIDSPELMSLMPEGDSLHAEFRTVVRRGSWSLSVHFRQRLWFNDDGQIVRSVLTFEDEDGLNAFFGATS